MEKDSTLILLTDENLRIASNRRITAFLKKGIHGKFIYSNNNKCWYFASFNVSTDNPKKLTNKKSIFRFYDIERPYSTSLGGDFPDEVSRRRHFY